MSDTDRDYDLVLWGATGFTGRLVAEHLADRYGDGALDWALAGRDADRLAAVRDSLIDGVDHGDADDADSDAMDGNAGDGGDATVPDLLTGDAHDRASLDAVAERTAVVCSTVGPYARHGSPLVAACVDAGTDYCDLSGELQWIRRMVDEHHDRARERGVRVVHACGFDSVPGDLGTLLLQSHAAETFGAPCSAVRALVSVRGGGFSGGTLASMVETAAAADRDRAVRRVLANPYALAPEGERGGPDTGPQRGVRRDPETREWTAPFVMAAINEPVVRRSNALLGHPWGRTFGYREALAVGRGVRGAAVAGALAAGEGLAADALGVAPIRWALDRFVLPDSGEGPDRDTVEGGSFEMRLFGRGVSADHPAGYAVEATVADDRDPGYGSASRMLAEAAVCLARGETDTPVEGGVSTPASGIGLPLVDRLEGAGVSFEVSTREGAER